MKSRTFWNILLGVILCLSLYLYIWTPWPVSLLLLQIIPPVCIQLLICNFTRRPLLRAIPSLLTGGLALWGIYLYLTSPAWAGATLLDLLGDYVSPVCFCLLAWAIHCKWVSR